MKQKTTIDFTKDEIETIYYSLMEQMNKSLRSAMSCNFTFETLENWYLLLKKVRRSLPQYEQATSEKALEESN